MGNGLVLPRGTHSVFGDERMASKIEVLEGVEAGKDADKERDQLGLWPICARPVAATSLLRLYFSLITWADEASSQDRAVKCSLTRRPEQMRLDVKGARVD